MRRIAVTKNDILETLKSQIEKVDRGIEGARVTSRSGLSADECIAAAKLLASYCEAKAHLVRAFMHATD